MTEQLTLSIQQTSELIVSYSKGSKFHRQRNLAGYSPTGRKEWDMTEHARAHTHMRAHTHTRARAHTHAHTHTHTHTHRIASDKKPGKLTSGRTVYKFETILQVPSSHWRARGTSPEMHRNCCFHCFHNLVGTLALNCA